MPCRQAVRCIRGKLPAHPSRPLGGDGGEVEQHDAQIQRGVEVVGVGVLLLHQIDAVATDKEAVGLAVEVSHNLLNCFCHFILEWPPFVL